MANDIALYLSYPPGHQLEDDEGKGLPTEYGDYLVMKTMGWDWWTYMNQPDHVVYMITSFIAAEEEAKEKRKNAKH